MHFFAASLISLRRQYIFYSKIANSFDFSQNMEVTNEGIANTALQELMNCKAEFKPGDSHSFLVLTPTSSPPLADL